VRTGGSPVHQEPRVGPRRGRRGDRRHHRPRPGRARRCGLRRVARDGRYARGRRLLRRRRERQGRLGPVRAGGRRGRRGQQRAGGQPREDQRRPLRRGLDSEAPGLRPGRPPLSRRLREAARRRVL
ncbi:MAG: Glycine cleavage system H protein, partial [uncultured Rubrobacteraceae bacterium]